MTITFDRPLGAHRDIRELEYLSALHQTDTFLRKNGSITAKDVVYYLLSRHGIQADEGYIRQHIMPGLAGACNSTVDEEGSSCVFDLVEVVGILIAPHLKRVALERPKLQDKNNLFNKVHSYILNDVLVLEERKLDDEPPIFNRAFVIQMLETYGEYDVPPAIIDKLLAAAGEEYIDQPFSVETLIKATTSDLNQYNLEWEDSPTTHYHDVFSGTKLDQQVEKSSSRTSLSSFNNQNGADEELAMTRTASTKLDEASPDQVKQVFTFSSLDYVAENFRSKVFVTVLWVLVIVIYFNYIINLTVLIGTVDCKSFKSDFGCRVVNSLVAWLIVFVQLSILGFSFLALSSFGNSVYRQRNAFSFLSIIVGMGTIVCATILSYVYEFESFIFNTRKEDSQARHYAGVIVVVLGCILLLFQLKALLFLMVPPSFFEQHMPKLKRFLIPSMARAELSTKKAAAFKIDRMIKDAVALHEGTLKGSSLKGSSQDVISNLKRLNSRKGPVTAVVTAMLNYQATIDDRETVGGARWAWKKMLNGKIWDEDGVWIHSRLFAGNCVQLFVCILQVLISVGVMLLLNGMYNDLQEPEPYSLEEYLIPARWQVNLSMSFAGICSTFAAIALFVIWIPSSVSTILKFRSGVIGSLRDKDFEKYRRAPDVSTILFGLTFWGALIASLVIFLLVGVVTFLCVWQVTRPIAITIIAQIIGISVTIVLKIIILIFLRRILFAGFFRQHPARANVLMVVMECWNIALTALAIVQRLVKLFFIAAFYVARIDTLMLAQGVGEVVGQPIDGYPIQFRKDLVIHDAHRHPYMERLGVLYMLKLRYGDDFASQAGSTWRLLFCMSLMPWMRRYRINEMEDELPEEGEEQLHALQKTKTAKSRKLIVMFDDDDESNDDDDESNDDDDDHVLSDDKLTMALEDTSCNGVSEELLREEIAILQQKIKALEKRLLESNNGQGLDD